MIIYKNRYKSDDTITITRNEKTNVFTLIFEHNGQEVNRIYFGEEAAKTIKMSLGLLLQEK